VTEVTSVTRKSSLVIKFLLVWVGSRGFGIGRTPTNPSTLSKDLMKLFIADRAIQIPRYSFASLFYT
jgi:hypothetical protein